MLNHVDISVFAEVVIKSRSEVKVKSEIQFSWDIRFEIYQSVPTCQSPTLAYSDHYSCGKSSLNRWWCKCCRWLLHRRLWHRWVSWTRPRFEWQPNEGTKRRQMKWKGPRSHQHTLTNLSSPFWSNRKSNQKRESQVSSFFLLDCGQINTLSHSIGLGLAEGSSQRSFYSCLCTCALKTNNATVFFLSYLAMISFPKSLFQVLFKTIIR